MFKVSSLKSLIHCSDVLCKNLEERFLSRKFVYIPYLGKNDHIATINEIEVIDHIKTTEDFNKIDSIFIKNKFEFMQEDDFGFDDLEEEDEFKYQEKLPYKLERTTNQYILETLIYTNMKVSSNENTEVYKVNDLNLYFI